MSEGDKSKVMQKWTEGLVRTHKNPFEYDQAWMMAGFVSMKTRIVCGLAAMLGLGGAGQASANISWFESASDAPMELKFRTVAGLVPSKDSLSMDQSPSATGLQAAVPNLKGLSEPSKKAGKTYRSGYRPLRELQQAEGVLVGHWLLGEPALAFQGHAVPNDNSGKVSSSQIIEAAAEPVAVSKSNAADLSCELYLCLRVSRHPDQPKIWQLKPQQVHFDENTQQASLQFDFAFNPGQEPLIFVRDSGVVHWDAKTRTLQAQGPGQTELYLVNQAQMIIVPVVVDRPQGLELASAADSRQDLTIAQDLVLIENQAVASDFANAGRSSAAADKVKRFSGSQLQVEVTTGEASDSRFHVRAMPASTQTADIQLQLVDERSNPAEKQLYPLADVEMRVLGSSYQAASDVKGLWSVEGMPVNSSFLLVAEDPDGRILPHVYPVDTFANDGQPLKRRLRALSFERYAFRSQVFQVAQDSSLASLCLRTYERDGSQAMAELSVQINRDADGPFYFRAGMPSPSASTTGDDGQVCFFNVASGLVELSFLEDERLLTALTLPLLAGHHLEDDLYLWNGDTFDLRIAAYPSATEQLYSVEPYLSLRDLDFSELVAVGENFEIDFNQDGVLRWLEMPSHYQGQVYGLSQGAEFEAVLYPLSMAAMQRKQSRAVLPLFPRGFVEELYQELYLNESEMAGAFEPSLGSVLVYHQITASADASGIRFKLYDEYGRSVKDGWYFGSGQDGFVKGVFFNLDAGIYQLVVEDQSGAWLQTKTLAVDYWTSTYVQTGADSVEPIQLP